MNQAKVLAVMSVICTFVAVSSVQAATIPAGTILTVSTVSVITSRDALRSSFEAKIAQDVAVRGNVLLKAGTKAFGKVKSSRANPHKSEPLTVELTSVSLNGRNVPVKTNTFQPGSPPVTGRQSRYGHTAGTLRINPGTLMQFQLLQPVTL